MGLRSIKNDAESNGKSRPTSGREPDHKRSWWCTKRRTDVPRNCLSIIIFAVVASSLWGDYARTTNFNILLAGSFDYAFNGWNGTNVSSLGPTQTFGSASEQDSDETADVVPSHSGTRANASAARHFGSEGNSLHNALERHYLSVYRSMMSLKQSPPKFVLYRFSTHGIGNKIRGLLGAMFLAAITDRVLLVESDVITSLFLPPVVDGTVLDWNSSLADGLCDNGTVLETNPSRQAFVAGMFDFHNRYGGVGCVIASASHGHDRQIAILNEGSYKDKILALFGGSTSRFNWSRDVLGLVLQHPAEALSQAGRSEMIKLGFDSVPPSHRMAIHIRTYHGENEKFYSHVIGRMNKAWDCIERLVKGRVEESRFSPNVTSISVLFLSDSPDVKAEAKGRLESMRRVRVITSDIPFTHSEHPSGTVDPFVEWFMMGECSAVITTGWSSFGFSAFFRPAPFPKDLFTVDRLGLYRYGNMMNNQCGRVEPQGYGDINYGIMDPLYEPEKLESEIAKVISRNDAAKNRSVTSITVPIQHTSSNNTVTNSTESVLAETLQSDMRSLSVVSFSIFGNDTKYGIPLVLNARTYIPEYYPGWQMRIYHDSSVSTEILTELRRHSHVRLVNVEDRSDPLLDSRWFEWLPRAPQTVWRYLAASDPKVDTFLIRDSDSIPNERELAAVNEWMESGAAFHIMHDFPIHYYFGKTYVMMAGMWGGRGGKAAPDMDQLLQMRYERGDFDTNFTFDEDQKFLRDVIWPLVEAMGPSGSVRHNSFHCSENEGISFPTAGTWDYKGYDFVGEQIKVSRKEDGEWIIRDRDDSNSGACWVRKFLIRSKWRSRYQECIQRRVDMGYRNETLRFFRPPVAPKCYG